jgi:hypothetical protein
MQWVEYILNLFICLFRRAAGFLYLLLAKKIHQMKRRDFIRGVGMGSAGLSAGTALGNSHPGEIPALHPYRYGKIRSLGDARNREGMVMLRVAWPEGEAVPVGQLGVEQGVLQRVKSYFLGSIAVLWLQDVTEETTVVLQLEGGFRFTLGELVEKQEVSRMVDGHQVRANFLLDREIGEITLMEAGIKEPGPEFTFVAMADPQGGYPDDTEGLKTRMKIHNAFIEESVDLINKLDVPPLFTMVTGDVCDDWGYEKDLAQMNRFLSGIRCPVLYGIGNHETLLRSTFGPGYNMDAFNNYLAAQKAMNGLEKLLYSFNAGEWHFVVWPDPLRDGFWETHPHYFDWLESDLEKHRDRPVMVFQHVPSHPVGISPHINYAESVEVKRTFLEILSRYGNVKYVLSGHVHIPVKASFKTAVSYRGFNLITLPAAGYRPRAFGEEDYFGGPSQGIALVHINRRDAEIKFKTVTEETFVYPADLPPFDEASYPLWLQHPWELQAEDQFVNGEFKHGLEGWARRFVYKEDKDASNLCEMRNPPAEPERTALYLYCKKRGYLAPGQDRLPQDINRIGQAVKINRGSRPRIRFDYMIDGNVTLPGSYAGGYAWIEGFSGTRKVLNMMYSAGKIWVNIGGKYAQIRQYPYVQFDLPDAPDIWHTAELDLAGDYNRAGRQQQFNELHTDRLVINLGVWNLNDGGEHSYGIYFTGFEVGSDPDSPSRVDGRPVAPKPKEDEWWRNKTWPWKNIAGEHRYIIATRDPFDL